jgi:DNA-directed RNA polymerase specialized sigma subunit|tara:strand:- start:1193 stop:1384 length:192 start_codon:yes stop_codon:yes gene_type:complete
MNNNENDRSWIDYPEDDNCIYVAIEKHGAMTLEEVSKRLGISLVRVSQIEKKALAKLAKRIKI